jgi:hypothetical protein
MELTLTVNERDILLEALEMMGDTYQHMDADEDFSESYLLDMAQACDDLGVRVFNLIPE